MEAAHERGFLLQAEAADMLTRRWKGERFLDFGLAKIYEAHRIYRTTSRLPRPYLAPFDLRRLEVTGSPKGSSKAYFLQPTKRLLRLPLPTQDRSPMLRWWQGFDHTSFGWIATEWSSRLVTSAPPASTSFSDENRLLDIVKKTRRTLK
jgi:hypothetical protein